MVKQKTWGNYKHSLLRCAIQTFDGFHTPELLPYLRERGKRFLLTAGLVTSVCVFLTTASATQVGFLTTMVEDCCADEPSAHEGTLERYQFIFDRVTVDQIVERRAEWSLALEVLEGGNPSRHFASNAK